MGIEFFDAVVSGVVLHFHQRFGEVLGVDVTRFIQGLRVGVDSEERAARGDGGDEGAGAAFVPFEVASRVSVIPLRNGIGDASDFHNFRGENVLVGWKF